MNKRGMSLSMETLVVAVIVLIVLFVVVAIFLTQSGKYVGEYSDVAKTASEQAKGCNILFGRYCSVSCGNDNKLTGKFDECVSDGNTGGICCEKKPENG